MNSADDRIILEIENDRPATKVWTVIAAGVAFTAAWLFLGSVGSPVDVPSDDLPDITAPPQQPLAIMPDLAGVDVIEVFDLLRDAGLDTTLVAQSQWIANAEVPAGTVTSQQPAPGVDVFDPNEVSLVMSAGGPVVSWADVPEGLRDMIEDGYTIDRTEPILVVETASGRVYKTDDLLFGPCEGVDQSRNTFYDRSFSGLCQVSPPESIVGWLPDGAMFAVEGLPPQPLEGLSGNVQWMQPDGSELLLWAQSWDTATIRLDPTVVVVDDTVTVLGGFYVLSIVVDHPDISPGDVAKLIDPVDIRGSLVLNVSDPLTFGQFVDRAPARRYQNATVVSDRFGVNVAIDPEFSGEATVTTLAPSRWSVAQSDPYQYATASGWETAAHSTDEPRTAVFSASTFPDTNPGEWCGGVYPTGSLMQLGRADAFVGVYYGESTDFNLWLDHFSPLDVAPVAPLDPALECLEKIDAEVRTTSRFLDGVALDIVMGFGAEADPEVRAQAFAILDSFEEIPIYCTAAGGC